MSKPSGIKHDNYDILNLIGYGLAKFEKDLVAAFGFETKSGFYQYFIDRGVAKTVGTLKNRQDLFNPLVRNAKVGWWQNGDRYLHRKILLDSLFGSLGAEDYAVLLRMYLQTHFPVRGEKPLQVVPLLKSKFRLMQETGAEAEMYFVSTFRSIPGFETGDLEDARLYGDGYDFQIKVCDGFKLVEVKGVRKASGSVRLTQNEYAKACEYKGDYCLAVVSQLENSPRVSLLYDPTSEIILTESRITSEQIFYTSPVRKW